MTKATKKKSITDEQLLKAFEDGLKTALTDHIKPLAQRINRINEEIEKLHAYNKNRDEIKTNDFVCEPQIKLGNKPLKNFVTLFDENPNYAVTEMFRYHKPDEYQVERYNEIRAGFKLVAKIVLENVSSQPLQRAIIQKIWEANMLANGGVATQGIF